MFRLVVVVWLVSGFVGAGFYRANLRYVTPTLNHDEARARTQAGVSTLFMLGGPVYLTAALALSGGGYEGWESLVGDCFWHKTSAPCSDHRDNP